MLITKHKDKFILKHIDTCAPGELFKCYEFYHNTFWGSSCPQRVGLFGDCLRYLKSLVIKYKPLDVLKATSQGKKNSFTKDEVEQEYIKRLVDIAAIEEFFEEYKYAAYFAKKALNMVNYFHPYLNEAGKEKLWQEKRVYKLALNIYEDRKEHLTEEFYNDYKYFDWEYDFYLPLPDTYSNQNFTGLVVV